MAGVFFLRSLFAWIILGSRHHTNNPDRGGPFIGLALGDPIWPLIRPETHPDLSNRDKWLDHLRSSPVGKLYKLHRQMAGVGLDFDQFDLLDRPLVLHEGGGDVTWPEDGGRSSVKAVKSIAKEFLLRP